MFKTEPIIEEILQNFFNEKDAEKFNAIYHEAQDDENLEFENKKIQSHIDFEIDDGLRIRSQIDLLITFAESKLSKESFIDLLLYLGQVTITSGELSSAIEIHEKIISQTKEIPEMVNITANAYLFLGEIYSRQAKWELSFSFLDKAVKLFSDDKDFRGSARCENLYGTIYGDKGNLEIAYEHFENALSALQESADGALVGKVDINLGIFNNIMGNYDNAISYLKRALLIFEDLKDLKRIAEIRQNLGMVYTKIKKYNYALSEFDLCLDTSIQANYLQTLGIGYISKAYVYTQLEDFALADAFADKAMEVSYKISDKLTIAEVYKIKGIVKRSKGNFDVAENYLNTSYRLNKEAGNLLNLAETNFELGMLFKQTKHKVKSELHFREALSYYSKINAKEEVEEINKHLS